MEVPFILSEVCSVIYVTGDLHGDHDTWKLSGKNPDAQKLKSLTKQDYLIICGDFGMIWDGSETDSWWLDWLGKKPYTTLFIDGNHENFDLLAQYPVSEWNGGLVQEIRPGILHLMRGQMFTIDGLRFFAMGGAESHDKEYRREGVSWWKQELPSPEEIGAARETLDACGWETDFVITHSLPSSVQTALFRGYGKNRLTDFFDELSARLQYRKWFSGHYHIDLNINFARNMRAIYNDILQIG